MHIARLQIRNFRTFHASTFQFSNGVNTLVGENESGKSNALFALRLMIDENLSYRSQRLRESDFSRVLDSWRGHWIVLRIEFAELDASEGCQILRHGVGHMDGASTGSLTFLYRPVNEVRATLHEMTKQVVSPQGFAAFRAGISIEQYEALLMGRGTADYTDDSVYEALVGDFENNEFPDPDEEDSELVGWRVFPIYEEITCTFVEALRDVVADLRGFRNNPLLGLLRGTETVIEIGDARDIHDAVLSLNTRISNLDEIKKIAAGVQDTLESTVGKTYSPQVDIESSLPDDIELLLRRLALKVGDALGGSYRGDIAELGLGAANLIFLSLRLLEYELKLSSDRVAHFLLIEEPESHLHTHIQRTLFEKYKSRSTQVIVTTHSSHLSSASQISRMNILARASPEAAEVFQPSRRLDADMCTRIERYLDAVRSTLLFAKGVILVEGDAELILIPALVRRVFGLTLDELGISVVGMSSAVFENVATLFHSDRIRRRCAILTDLDESIVPLPDDPTDDNEFESRCRRSQTAGVARQERLLGTYEDNDFVSLHFADYTFEIEFVLAGNEDEFAELIPHAFRTRRRRERARELLASEDLGIWGRETLRIARKLGKGWAALLLTEILTSSVVIPWYVLEALGFVTRGSTSSAVLRSMLTHRVHEADLDFDTSDDAEADEDLLARFRGDFPEDPLSIVLDSGD